MTRDKMTATRKAFEAWAKESGWGIDKMGPDEEWSEVYESATVRCMWRAWQAAVAQQPALSAETASALQALIDFAVERTRHRYKEDCPDPVDHDVRDPDCPVCNTIVRAEKLLTDHIGGFTNMVAVPAGWKLVPTTPHGDMLRSVGRWADAMAYETYTAMLAAAPEMKP